MFISMVTAFLRFPMKIQTLYSRRVAGLGCPYVYSTIHLCHLCTIMSLLQQLLNWHEMFMIMFIHLIKLLLDTYINFLLLHLLCLMLVAFIALHCRYISVKAMCLKSFFFFNRNEILSNLCNMLISGQLCDIVNNFGF